jgi:hypothetical protein
MVRTFEHMLDLNRPSRPLVRPPALTARRPVQGFERSIVFGTKVETIEIITLN